MSNLFHKSRNINGYKLLHRSQGIEKNKASKNQAALVSCNWIAYDIVLFSGFVLRSMINISNGSQLYLSFLAERLQTNMGPQDY